MRILLIGSEGYIGSSLKQTLIQNMYELVTCDLKPSDHTTHHIQIDYGNLTDSQISKADLIILLAAHSSVQSCVLQPIDAIQNNIVNFLKLISKLNPNQTLIYASSGSVYDGYNNTFPTEEATIKKSRNIYDFTKISNDLMATSFAAKTIGLRFGTLSGKSPTMRSDLIINKMTSDAIVKKKIHVSNPNCFRSCLAINDLEKAFLTLISKITLISESSSIFNLSSFSDSIDNIARKIAMVTGADLIQEQDSPTYNFSMSTNKFEKLFNFKFQENIESIVKNLISH